MNPLTWKEIQEIFQENNCGYHIWVEFLTLGDIVPAIITEHPEIGLVAVWCAAGKNSFLSKESYGSVWVAYPISEFN